MHLPAAESCPVFAPSMLLQAECQAEALPPFLKAQSPSRTLQAATAVEAEERTRQGRIPKLGSRASDCSLDHQGLVRIFFTNKPNARYILSTSPPFPSHLRHYLDSLQKLKLHSKCCLLRKDLNQNCCYPSSWQLLQSICRCSVHCAR